MTHVSSSSISGGDARVIFHINRNPRFGNPPFTIRKYILYTEDYAIYYKYPYEPLESNKYMEAVSS